MAPVEIVTDSFGIFPSWPCSLANALVNPFIHSAMSYYDRVFRPRHAHPALAIHLLESAIAAMVLSQAAAAQDLYISNARVLDVGARVQSTRNILIRDGKLAGFPATKPSGFSGPVIDAGGRWLMPALSDMHVHSVGNFMPPGGFQTMGPETVARAALYAGVARYLDLFSAEDSIFAARESRRAAKTAAADIFAAGPCLTATRGHCSEYGVPTRIVDSPADAIREVNLSRRSSRMS